MSVGEFDLIARYFRRSLPARNDVVVGIGDDGAVVRVGHGQSVVTTIATLSTTAWDACAGDPSRLGHDAMAMAIEQLIAAGAEPVWATLALTLAEADERWLAAFSDALFAVATPLGVSLIGGDTTRGPFSVTVVGHGLAERNRHKPPAIGACGDSPV
jgi:thiamine-monophosphate kinase